MIEVQNLTKRYGKVEAVNDVSFSVGSHEVLGFLGPNGAGKTTVMKILTGYHYPSGGKAIVDGINVTENPVEVKKRIGYLPESVPLYGDLTVDEYLSFAAQARLIPARERKAAINASLEACALMPYRGRKIETLSKGYRQRTGLAQAILHDPPILILDEPTTGLDPNQIIEIRNLIKEVGKEKTVLLSTHIMQEAEAVCQRIVIIDRGVIMANEEKDKIYSLINQTKQTVIVEFDKETDLLKLSEIKTATTIKPTGINTWQIEAEGEDDIRPAIFKFAVDNNLTVLSLNKRQNNLEEIFRHLTTDFS